MSSRTPSPGLAVKRRASGGAVESNHSSPKHALSPVNSLQPPSTSPPVSPLHPGQERRSSGSVAKRRWRLLCRAVTSNRHVNNAENRDVSVRRFSTFQLFEVEHIPNPGARFAPGATHLKKERHLKDSKEPASDVAWFEYCSKEDHDLSAKIRVWTKKIKVRELLDFDNTGNVCVWPSEEVLAYYLAHRPELSKDKVVCELGGGMTCLAGLFAALNGAKHVILSDGNAKAVANVQEIVAQSGSEEGERRTAGRVRPLPKRMSARVIRWDAVSETASDLHHAIDLIVSADCLFFDNFRQSLVNAIDYLLAQDGACLILAPTRKATMEDFCRRAEAHGFRVSRKEKYDDVVNAKLQQALTLDLFDKDIHYPLLIEIERKKERPL